MCRCCVYCGVAVIAVLLVCDVVADNDADVVCDVGMVVVVIDVVNCACWRCCGCL